MRDAIVSENVEIPGGYIPQGDAELTLRTLGRLESTEQFSNIVVASAGPNQALSSTVLVKLSGPKLKSKRPTSRAIQSWICARAAMQPPPQLVVLI